MRKIRRIIQHLQDRIRLNKRAFMVYSVLRVLVIATAIRSAWGRNYENLALCLLSLLLFLLPAFFEETFRVEIPPLFEAIIYFFIFAAEILGEVNQYYTAIEGWDTMLHTLNGFLCAAIGFSLVDILNRQSRRIQLSPIYLAIVAFCFSMTIGVVWEFFEFSADQLFYLDMQKDFIVKDIASVKLDPTNSQIPVKISDIARTLIETAGGAVYTIEGGYLDIGIIDTMKDLFVNFIGAAVFSVIGYFYVRNRENKKDSSGIAASLIPYTLSEEEMAEQEVRIRQHRDAVQEKKKARRKK